MLQSWVEDWESVRLITTLSVEKGIVPATVRIQFNEALLQFLVVERLDELFAANNVQIVMNLIFARIVRVVEDESKTYATMSSS